jgi:hypothetical protein
MKKIFAILAVCFVMVSCQWWHETFDSPAECTKWYLDQIYEAGQDGDTGKVADLQADYNDWLNGLDERETMEAGIAALEWLDSHPEVMGALDGMFGGYDDYDYDDYDDYGW